MYIVIYIIIYNNIYYSNINYNTIYIYIYYFPRHAEVPGPGIKCEPQQCQHWILAARPSGNF